MMTVRKWLRIGRDGIKDALENAELTQEERRILQEVLELHEKAINGDITYDELDKAIDNTPFWATMNESRELLIFLGTEISRGDGWLCGIKKKLKDIRRKTRGGWQFFLYRRESITVEGEGEFKAAIVFGE